MSEFEFEIVHRAGAKQQLSDALSRRPDYCLKPEEDVCRNQNQKVLTPVEGEMNAVCMRSPVDDTLLTKIQQATMADRWFNDHREDILSGRMKKYTFKDNVVLYNNLV